MPIEVVGVVDDVLQGRIDQESPARLVGAVGLSPYLSNLLFGLTALDQTTYLFVAVGFAAVSNVAAYIPARRATQVDPAIALRTE